MEGKGQQGVKLLSGLKALGRFKSLGPGASPLLFALGEDICLS